MQKQQLLYKGKAKSVYETEDNDFLILHFRDDTSALDGKRIEQLARKGEVNNRFNTFIMQKLSDAGIETHFEQQLSGDEVLVKRMDMLPVECVVRNYAAGSLVRRLGLEEGQVLTPPTFELFYKDDALGDPMVNESLAVTLGWANDDQLAKMKKISYQVNEVLKDLFDKGDLILVDFKLEFGVFHDRIVLGDEFSPDGCRIWDKATKKKLDKDRFRQSLGDVIEGYEEVARRIGVPMD
ncbi:phosphoribosylaminoimidazolesuccinocarboxamide synthase [Psychrobacter sp. FBL11]|uniref:Phosphoribosylaminoimidazole-succinocarboxamide synthase n=1 Tax=Psychrobacter saeujeotis TaxID=3143436 RepID=A0ABU9X908_9GAMM|nr:phosphoribosylaminoimidazolesuccinocarboxamide synthase [uncultured Psychrobacter sp.]